MERIQPQVLLKEVVTDFGIIDSDEVDGKIYVNFEAKPETISQFVNGVITIDPLDNHTTDTQGLVKSVLTRFVRENKSIKGKQFQLELLEELRQQGVILYAMDIERQILSSYHYTRNGIMESTIVKTRWGEFSFYIGNDHICVSFNEIPTNLPLIGESTTKFKKGYIVMRNGRKSPHSIFSDIERSTLITIGESDLYPDSGIHVQAEMLSKFYKKYPNAVFSEPLRKFFLSSSEG